MIFRTLLALITVITISVPSFAAKPPKNIITMHKATKIATSAISGTVVSSELEFEKKQWVYSFDIKSSDSKIHEILLNAKTGKIISNEIESAEKEAEENKRRIMAKREN